MHNRKSRFLDSSKGIV